MSRIVAIIQARMTSTRLPGKVLAEIGGRPALAYMLQRVRRSERLQQIVVATTVNATDDPVAELCNKLEVDVFRGDEMDVLGRYVAAAEIYDADPIVRLTADCPMIDPTVIDEAIDYYKDNDFDYVSNGIVRTYPDGLDVEVVSRAALKKASQETNHPICREHVTPYVRGDKPGVPHGNFKVGNFSFHVDFSHIRWTLDTVDDLACLQELAGLLPDDFTWMQALAKATKYPRTLGVPLR